MHGARARAGKCVCLRLKDLGRSCDDCYSAVARPLSPRPPCVASQVRATSKTRKPARCNSCGSDNQSGPFANGKPLTDRIELPIKLGPSCSFWKEKSRNVHDSSVAICSRARRFAIIGTRSGTRSGVRAPGAMAQRSIALYRSILRESKGIADYNFRSYGEPPLRATRFPRPTEHRRKPTRPLDAAAGCS